MKSKSYYKDYCSSVNFKPEGKLSVDEFINTLAEQHRNFLGNYIKEHVINKKPKERDKNA